MRTVCRSSPRPRPRFPCLFRRSRSLCLARSPCIPCSPGPPRQAVGQHRRVFGRLRSGCPCRTRPVIAPSPDSGFAADGREGSAWPGIAPSRGRFRSTRCSFTPACDRVRGRPRARAAETSESGDRSRADACFALAEQVFEEAGPARLALIRGDRRAGARGDACFAGEPSNSGRAVRVCDAGCLRAAPLATTRSALTGRARAVDHPALALSSLPSGHGRRAARAPMSGWFVPPPSRPVKSDEDLRLEREPKVAELARSGLLRSVRLRRAMLLVRREHFIPAAYRDHAYEELPLPLPGERATISCPHSYPLFYEPLGLNEGHRLLEVGVGSGLRRVPGAAGGGSRRPGRGDRDRPPLRSRSPGRTSGRPAIPTSSSSTPMRDSGTPSTSPTTGSASQPPAPRFRRRCSSSSPRRGG